uniref:Phosphoglycerate mutase n=1 Tax=Kalmanozyma brasiliensis (strain GHG001) TaxID=1365824 RepID=V5EKJ9_KALBG
MALNRLLVTLVRHGESQDNQQGIWAGFRDTPLTTNGISQARALGQSFANVPLTAIYCSDLKRAAMTADEILKSNRSIPPPPLVQSMSLREINFGQAEGQSYASAEWMQGSSGEDARNFHFPDGESLQEVNARIAKAVRQFILPRVEALRKKPPSEQSAAAADVAHICIVAHGIAIAELLRVFMALHDDSPSSPWTDPKTTYQRVRLENTGWSRLELAVPTQRDDELPSPSDSDSASPTKPNATSSRTAPIGSTTTAHSNAQSDYTDFGEVQTDLVEGPADVTSRMPSRLLLPSSHTASASRPVYVRILCQNQTDHLRGFSSQQDSVSSAAKTVAHLAGGGSASKTSTSAGSGAGAAGSTPSASAAAVGLPASSTLASIASNAIGSNTNANAATGPTTPTPGAAASATSTPKPFTTTPTSTRNLSSYDPRMMARELERAGASSMLAGPDAAPSSSASTYFPSPTAASILAADRQASISGHAGTSGSTGANASLDRGSISASPGVSSSLGATYTTQFSGAYPQGIPTSVAGTTSPNPASMVFPAGPNTSSDTWQMICIRVLPLFNGEALRTSIEDLNEMVSLHVRRTLDRGQSHAVESLTLDIMSLASTGILTINSKLQGLEDTRLLLRLVEVWTFFLGQVLPYCEACFLPIQTDAAIRSLIATSSSYGAAAGGGASNIVGPFNTSSAFAPSNAVATQRIDVRRLLLIVFRDQVLFPIQERLSHLFAHLAELDPAFAAAEGNNIGGGGDDGIKQISLRLLQMTSVLASILSEDEAQEAMDGLLRALRLGSKA